MAAAQSGSKDNSSLALISVDVGGTLGATFGRSITEILASASELPISQAQSILRSTLLVSSEITQAMKKEICELLGINISCFPSDYITPDLQLYSWTESAIKSLNELAPVVTLSNVSCLDCDPEPLKRSLGRYIKGHFPSCRLGYSKPDRRAFESVATRHSISITRMVHIGDDWDCDIVGALSAGARAVWISERFTNPNCDLHVYNGRLSIARDLSEAAEKLHAFASEEVT